MKISIVHLTDIHFNDTNNWVDVNISNIIKAITPELQDIKFIFIVVTGDIANRGKTSEYGVSEAFFLKLKESLKRFCGEATIKYIIIPGNHDCNFSYDTQLRKNQLVGMDYKKLGDDNSVIDLCTIVQQEYWKFHEKLIGTPDNKLFFQIREEVAGRTICFNCYNTSWMSEIEEKVGSLFFPIELIEKNMIKKADGLNIALFHHPLNWFTPNTEKNNKKEFKKHLEESSSILLYGHEHEDEHIINKDINTEQQTVYVSGKALQGNKNSSGFQVIKIDIDTKDGNIRTFIWNKSLYTMNFDRQFKMDSLGHWHKDFIHRAEFLKKLNLLNLPLKFENIEKTNLSDIYIFPDLEKLTKEEKKIDDGYLDSEHLFINSDLGTVILEGENQSGKSSLMNMLYLKLVELNQFPLLVDASEFKKLEYDKIIKRTFEEQYKFNEVTFDAYIQFDSKRKILLIDNLQDLEFNSKSIVNLIKEFRNRFTRIIIFTGSIYAHLPAIKSELENVDCYHIKPLGYKKRNDLIEKYHKLNESTLHVTDQAVLEKTKHSFDQVQTVLGNKLIPSYPVYILSILQSLNYNTPYNLEQTSLGYCYQTLIYIALVNKAKIRNEDVDSYFNFLTEFAYNLNERSEVLFNDNDLEEFYSLYSKRYVSKPLSEIKNQLWISNIFISDEDGYYKFGYEYIFYFLIAKKIAEIIATKEGKEKITFLCKNLHKEKNANILVLTAHHTKDNYLIDEATLASMVPFNNLASITLKRDDNFYKIIEGIVKDISSDIISSDKTPMEERKKMLVESDKREQALASENSDEKIGKAVDFDEKLQSMIQSFRAIEIVGQIVKNRKGSLDKDKLTSMITELYNTGFRTISFFGNIINSSKDEYVISLGKKVDNHDSKIEIEKKVNNFFQYISLQSCLHVFSKLVYSVGHKDLQALFDDVAKNINTPAAKLVTFGIKTYYDKISVKELKELAEEFSNNPVALSILKARTRSYVYNNYVDYKKKQQIADALNMKVLHSNSNAKSPFVKNK
jgi:predicted MPP superfamily phosphohydrolase